MAVPAATREELEELIAATRPELLRFCYRMLGSPFDAEEAVQEASIRAWRAVERFEGRSQLRSWLYRIAANVCLDMCAGRERRARPMDLGPAGEPIAESLRERTEATWVEPLPDPADAALAREGVRLAFVAALQMLPARQRAALILCEVLHWQAAEAAELLQASVASVNSALQRARATLEHAGPHGDPAHVDAELLARYVEAFEAYDFERLTRVIHEDAVQSMPPFDLWLRGREDLFAWWEGPGAECRGSVLVPAGTVGGAPAFAQYKPDSAGGLRAWALLVVEGREGLIGELTFFLSTDRLLPLWGLPPHLDSRDQAQTVAAESDEFRRRQGSEHQTQPQPEGEAVTTTTTVIKGIGLVCVPTLDQDRSIAYYTDKLGFEKRTDIPMGPNMRWVEVFPPEGTTGIALAPPPPGKAAEPMDTGITLETDDIDAAHAQLQTRGADVDAEVSRLGGTVPPMFWIRDPEGHRLIVVQPDRG